ncbi:MAG TPA: GNAT family N-acetyltransferase [Nocardioides sp.]|nr:GNAT family N-acetyltransferase [Nocardioides sp.]
MLPSPTARLRFRELTPDDLDDLTAVLGAPDPVRPDRRLRTREDAERWIAWNLRNYAEHGYGLWAVETHDGRFVGDCGLTWQELEGDQHLEVGYHVALDLRGQGLATEAAAAVRRAATEAGMPHLVAIIRPENLPSQRVAAHIGLRLERRAVKNGGDVVVYGADLLRVVPAAPDRLAEWRAVHNEIIPTAPLSPDEVAERATRHDLTVGYVGDTLVGCATLRPPSAGTATVIVRVLPAFRRRGLGSAYLERVVEDARALTPERLETVVLASNPDGLAFAQRHGFVEHERYLLAGHTVPFVDLRLEV